MLAVLVIRAVYIDIYINCRGVVQR
uniref:Uncharacterized protein n=1 Tax=Anguilla anguilla TaxID=7936 RepID=A0A0E9TXF8_ANGAN